MQQTKRLLSLDILRGITIAGMILVNNPGSWGAVYGPLLHADWHGCTVTDWVFPFFLFMVGVAVPLALGARKSRGDAKGAIVRKILVRTAIIFGWGLLLAAFPSFGMSGAPRWLALLHYVLLAAFMATVLVREVYNQRHNHRPQLRQRLGYAALGLAGVMAIIGFGAYDFGSLRIPGVLQRIALVYGACGLLFLYTPWRMQLYVGLGLLLGYWFLMTAVPVPGHGPANLDPETNLGAWLDNLLLQGHLWSQSKVWDPEGLLSTLPAIGTGIIGMLTGTWLQTDHTDYKKITGILGVGLLLLAVSLVWDLAFPINKKIWTSSYTLYTGGIAMLGLGLIYWIVDVLGYKKWTPFFVAYGTNALFAYIASGVLAKLLFTIKWGADATGEAVSLQTRLYGSLFTPYLDPFNASLAWALLNVAIIWLLVLPLYRRRIFIKV